MLLTQNFKKIEGSNSKNFNKLNNGLSINLRNFWDSNSGILKNAKPDPLTLGFFYKKESVIDKAGVKIGNGLLKDLGLVRKGCTNKRIGPSKLRRERINGARN